MRSRIANKMVEKKSLRVASNGIVFLSFDHTLYLRGVAIILVVISHIGNYSGKTWFTPLGGIGVSIFLFCSAYGLCCSYKKNGLKDYWKKKIIAVYVPFFLVEIVVSIICKVPLALFIQDILFLTWLNPNGWYMQYLVICYVLFFFIMKYICNSRIRILFWIIASLISFFFCGNLRGEQADSFVLGIVVADKINDIEKASEKRKRIIAVLFFLTGLVILILKQIPIVRAQSKYLITLMNLLLKTSFMMGIVLMSASLHYARKVVTFFGEISYPFYLVHGYFMWIIAEDYTGNFFLNALLMLVISLVMSLVVKAIIPKRRRNVCKKEA